MELLGKIEATFVGGKKVFSNHKGFGLPSGNLIYE
jgi:hypothetical protein